MASSTVNLKADTKGLAEKIEAKITVKIYRFRQFKFRFWLATKLVNLAQAISWINFDILEQHPLERAIEEFGDRGITISITYGPTSEGKYEWSVECLNWDRGEDFGLTHQANSLAHCVEIAHKEAENRGWFDER